MDNSILKKKLSTFVSEAGQLRNVSPELLCEVLHAWEEWKGSAKDFYKSLGFSQKQMASLIGKAKKLKRDGHFGSENFKEIMVESSSHSIPGEASKGAQIELDCGKGQVIRFPEVGHLVDYMKKVGQ